MAANSLVHYNHTFIFVSYNMLYLHVSIICLFFFYTFGYVLFVNRQQRACSGQQQLGRVGRNFRKNFLNSVLKTVQMTGLRALLTQPNQVTILATLPGISHSSQRALIVCTTKNGVQQNRKAPGDRRVSGEKNIYCCQ